MPENTAMCAFSKYELYFFNTTPFDFLITIAHVIRPDDLPQQTLGLPQAGYGMMRWKHTIFW